MVSFTSAMKHLFFHCWLGLAAFGTLAAQDASQEDAPPAVETPVSQPGVEEKTIPEAFPEVRYQGTWAVNPFLRVTTGGIQMPKVDWTTDWALAGMYKSTVGKITITLQNKQTGEFKRVSSDGDSGSEFSLKSANFNRNRNEASATIEKDGKEGTVKYDDNLTSRPVTVTNTFKAPAGAPGAQGNPNLNPNFRPGQPQPVNATPPAGTQRAMVPPVQPGVAPQPGVGAAPGQAVAPSPPTISRRRQLIPAPVAPAPAPQQ